MRIPDINASQISDRVVTSHEHKFITGKLVVAHMYIARFETEGKFAGSSICWSSFIQFLLNI